MNISQSSSVINTEGEIDIPVIQLSVITIKVTQRVEETNANKHKPN